MNSLTLRDPSEDLLWSKNFEEGEAVFQHLKEAAEHENRNVIDDCQRLFFPVRTYNLRVLVEDLFFPTLFSALDKTTDIADNIFKIVSSTALDILTLAIRLITVIPRMLTNPSKDQNEFYYTLKHIAKEDADGYRLKRILRHDHVKVEIISKVGDRHFKKIFFHRFVNVPVFEGWNRQVEYGLRPRLF